MAEKCSGWTNNGYRCARVGKIKEEGNLWCSVHAPSRVEARQKELEERVDAQIRKRRRLKRAWAWNLVAKELVKINPELAVQVKAIWNTLRIEEDSGGDDC